MPHDPVLPAKSLLGLADLAARPVRFAQGKMAGKTVIGIVDASLKLCNRIFKAQLLLVKHTEVEVRRGTANAAVDGTQ